MKTVTDYLGRSLTFTFPPKKIISFAPAITNTLYRLGLDDEIVGRTRFCIHPKEKVEKAVNVGGTKDMKLARVLDMNPDLIIAEKEENTKEMVEELEKHFPVYVFEIQTVDDALKMIMDLGVLTEREQNAFHLRSQIENALADVPVFEMKKRAAYVIWKDPYMVVGKNTYINSLLTKLGFENPFIRMDGRYPEVTVDDLRNAELDYILLATEPYPFREKHVEEFLQISPNVKVLNVEGEMFWYGTNMLDAATYFKKVFTEM